jgi:eukaryotic-like serine/threonine-protein kinase
MIRGIAEKDALPGKTLRGTFTIAGKIGSGAVSDVYLARQKSVGNRNVAVKLLKKVICASDTAESEVHKRRFMSEAELLSMLKSGVFAYLIEAGVLKDEVERPYMIMEYIGGKDLSAYLATERRFSIDRAAAVTLYLAEGLRDVHRFKVVYRDLAPGNVIMEEAGPQGLTPRLFDLSHAVVTGVGGLDDSGEAGALLAGTPPYTAPELLYGRSDERSDVFSLAALFYAMVTGKPPMVLRKNTWDDYGVAIQRRGRVPEQALSRLVDRCPKGLDDVLVAALALNPDNRYASVGDFLAEFCDVLLKSPFTYSGAKSKGPLAGLIARVLLGR